VGNEKEGEMKAWIENKIVQIVKDKDSLPMTDWIVLALVSAWIFIIDRR